MKIRDPRLIAAAGWTGAGIARCLSSSLRFDHKSLGPVSIDPLQSPDQGAFIYALWHENFLVPITRFGNTGVTALVSSHADGQLLTPLLRATGVEVIHGSTNRGGVAAVRKLLRSGSRHIAVTPDGPRGPRRIAQTGVAYLASRTGQQIVPIGVGHQRPWRLKTWDQLVVPRPFSRVRCIFGRPMIVPAKISAAALANHARLVQSELERLTRAAQHWAETGRIDVLPDIIHTRLPVVEQPSRIVADARVRCESGE